MTEIQLERRELARRLIFLDDQLRGGVYLRCDMKGSGTDEDPSRPVIADLVPHWMSRQHPTADGAMIIHVPGSAVLPALPRGVERLTVNKGCLTDKWLAELRNLPDHERQKLLWQAGLEFGDFDAWVKPFALQASGLQSYAHTSLKYSEDFSVQHIPLSAGDFTAVDLADDGLQAKDGVCKPIAAYPPVPDFGLYSWDTAAQPANDCSVEAAMTNASQGSGVVGRETNISHFYNLRLAAALQLYKWNGGSTLLGSYGTATGGLIRLEMVGTALKGYLDGTERISVTDSGLASGWAGIKCRRPGATLTLDDLKLYVEAAAGSPFFYQRSVLQRRLD